VSALDQALTLKRHDSSGFKAAQERAHSATTSPTPHTAPAPPPKTHFTRKVAL
jgi:hypothetical protein